MDTLNASTVSSIDLDETIREDDARSQSSDSSVKSSRTAQTRNISTIAAYQRKLFVNAKVCNKCRVLYKFPEERSEASYHLTKVKKHLAECPHKSQKRPASERASAATPATKLKMNPPETVPKKLTIRPKDQNQELNVELKTFVSEYGDGSVGAKTPAKDIPGPKNTPEKVTNEPLDIESQGVEEMEVQTSNEDIPVMRKHAGIKQLLINNSPEQEARANVPINNRFEPLADLHEDQAPAASTATATTSTAKPKTPSKQPAKAPTPPPIVIVGNDNGDINAGLDRVTSGDYWVKYTSNSIILHTNNMPDYEAAIRALNEEQIRYHTYATNGRKTHAFVLRGMGRNHTAEQILRHIKADTPVNILKCFPMKTLGVPLFLVVTDTNWNIVKLNKEVPRILRTAVQWENRKSSNPITQCRRCQTWGHSQGNCNRSIRCSKCAANHFVQDCAHQGKPVCANCKGEHRAFSRQCPVYESKISQYLEKFPSAKQQKPQYVPAPPPANPAWSPRAQQAATRSQAPPAAAGSAQAGPSYQTTTTYSQDFPTTPGQRRRPPAAAQPPPQQQLRPASTPANATDSVSQFHALSGKFDEINKLINFNGMLQALDIYLSMLRSAKTNDDLFMVSRDFFCNILPTIKLSP